MNISEIKKFIGFEKDGRDKRFKPHASVVIIIYNSGQAILDLLQSLKEQSIDSFEIIIINNGKIDSEVVELIKNAQVQYIESKWNSPSFGRNIGTLYARGDIIIFLDDDCIAHKELVKTHVLSYDKSTILGVQGKGIAYKHPFYCNFQSHYDLGDEIVPSVFSFEGNISARKNVLIEVGGFDPEFFGGEGSELSYRLVQEYKNPQGIIYNPEAIIYHDFAKGFFDYLEKCYRHAQQRKKLVRRYPEIMKFAKDYGPYPIPDECFSSLFVKYAVKVVGVFGRIAEQIGRLV